MARVNAATALSKINYILMINIWPNKQKAQTENNPIAILYNCT